MAVSLFSTRNLFATTENDYLQLIELVFRIRFTEYLNKTIHRMGVWHSIANCLVNLTINDSSQTRSAENAIERADSENRRGK